MEKHNPLKYLKAHLGTIYDPKEAESIAYILLEDAFDWHVHQKKEFDEWDKLESYTKALLQHKPIQYVLGEADFLGLKFKVDTHVLIPRAETEELADRIAKFIKKHKTSAKVLDIGTGSGCIPVYIKKECSHARVQACDVSAAALAIAQSNADRYNLPIDFFEIDILDRSMWSVFGKDFDIILSNPPYIPPSEMSLMPRHVKEFEPDLALYAPESDPLVFYFTIADFAREKLKSDGKLYFECNAFNAKKVAQLLENKGFTEVELLEDMMGMERMVEAIWKG